MGVSLRVALVLGSTRTAGVPRPVCVGRRVGKFVELELKRRGHTVDVVDPVVENLPLLTRPHFSYPSGESPHDALAERLGGAQAYVMVTPEYNHAPGPALLNLIDHFGSSTFSFKPSLIVSYSQGQWGGTRAAAGLRPVLSELGCLPVSAMIHVPAAHHLLREDGSFYKGDAEEERWRSYAARGLAQLEWWGEACTSQWEVANPFQSSPAQTSTPEERNAPPGSGEA